MRIAFVLVGGRHQLLHIVPVAAALSRRNNVSVELFAGTPELASATTSLLQRFGSRPLTPQVMHLPPALERLCRADANGVSMKIPRLLWWARDIRDCDAVVSAERTSTVLKRLPGPCPPMIHLRHGAGDRAVGFERRIALFDQVLVAGSKDRQRTIEAGLQPPERVHTIGHIKLSTLAQLRGSLPKLFGASRPVVLYNPHFNPLYSSWHDHARTLIQMALGTRLFNLIVAPHSRLFARASAAQKQEWEAMQVPDQVIIDLGSERSMDMTYTLAADIYLGDVSSQIYEFIATPRPCVFINTHAADWKEDADYRMWHMGEVAETPEGVWSALRRATSRHSRYLEIQRALAAAALGNAGPDCADHAADIILASLPQPVTVAA